MNVFERSFRHEPALIPGPVIAELGQRAVDLAVVARAGNAERRIAAGVDLSKTVNQRHRPGPRSLVDRSVEAELSKVKVRRLHRRRDVDAGSALVDRKSDIHTGRDPRTKSGYAARSRPAHRRRNCLAGRSCSKSRRASPQVRKGCPSMASDAPPPPGLLRDARPKPPLAWSPSRSRKLLPRFVIAAPEERSEVGVDGVGGGGRNTAAEGDGARTCAWTCCPEQLRKSATATKKVMPSRRPASVSTARKDRSDQPIDVPKIKGAAAPKNTNRLQTKRFVRSSATASIGLGPAFRAIDMPCCSPATGGSGVGQSPLAIFPRTPEAC